MTDNADTIDVGPEDTEDLRPADALLRLDDAEKAVRRDTLALEASRHEKKYAKAVATAVLEDYELDSARTTVADGTSVLFYTEPFRVFGIVDESKFDEWDAGRDENYYEVATKLREQMLQEECRRRYDDGEELPDGVALVFQETRIKRRAATEARTKAMARGEKRKGR